MVFTLHKFWGFKEKNNLDLAVSNGSNMSVELADSHNLCMLARI